MKSLISKRLIYRLTKFRIFTIAFVLGVSGFWIWQLQTQPKQNQAYFSIRLLYKNHKPETVIQNRNLSDYEQVFISDCSDASKDNYQDCVSSLNKARKLILKNWKEKKLTYIDYSWSSIDNGGEIYYFIEPNEKGSWHIIKRWKEYFMSMSSEENYNVISTEAVSLKLERNTKIDNVYREGKFYLKFFDKYGEQVGIL